VINFKTAVILLIMYLIFWCMDRLFVSSYHTRVTAFLNGRFFLAHLVSNNPKHTYISVTVFDLAQFKDIYWRVECQGDWTCATWSDVRTARLRTWTAVAWRPIRRDGHRFSLNSAREVIQQEGLSLTIFVMLSDVKSYNLTWFNRRTVTV